MQNSGLKIEKVKPATNKEWDATWINCDYATYFHSREWADIWRLYTNGFNKPAPEIVTFSDKKQALLPFTVQRRKNLIKTYFLSAEAQFGGWISTDTLEDEHTSLLVDYIDNRCSNLVWRWNPYCPFSVKMDINNIYELEEDETYSIDITCGFGEILKGCYHGHRCSYNKGKKEGLSIRLAENEQDWRDYYQAYCDSVRRWGEGALSHYDWRLFDIIRNLNSPYIKLWVVLCDGNVIAGALCFSAKRHIVCWHAAVIERYLHTRPMNFMFLEIMREAGPCGYRWFDFNTSAHLEGVKTFKKRFGAEKMQCNVVYKKSGLIKTYITIKNLIRKINQNN